MPSCRLWTRGFGSSRYAYLCSVGLAHYAATSCTVVVVCLFLLVFLSLGWAYDCPLFMYVRFQMGALLPIIYVPTTATSFTCVCFQMGHVNYVCLFSFGLTSFACACFHIGIYHLRVFVFRWVYIMYVCLFSDGHTSSTCVFFQIGSLPPQHLRVFVFKWAYYRHIIYVCLFSNGHTSSTCVCFQMVS